MAKTPTKAEMITRAIKLLRDGVFPSFLPKRLMAEYNLTPAKARELAQAAIKRWQAEDQSTKPDAMT